MSAHAIGPEAFLVSLFNPGFPGELVQWAGEAALLGGALATMMALAFRMLRSG